MARLFITHGGQNSLMQAVYHAVPVLAIPLFGDQFDNVVRAEAKGMAVVIRPTHITRELVSSTIRTVIHDVRFVEAHPKSGIQFNLPVVGQITQLPFNLFVQLKVQGSSSVPQPDPSIPPPAPDPASDSVGGAHPAVWRWSSLQTGFPEAGLVPEMHAGRGSSPGRGASCTCVSLLGCL